MPATACRYTCASALLATLVAAEWVEISQQRYRKPLQPARFHSQGLTPTKHTSDLLTPAQHPFLNHNLQNPTKTYEDSRNTYLYHAVTLENPISEDSFERDVQPPLSSAPDEKADKLNPFKDNSGMRNIYEYEHVAKNKYLLSSTKKPMRNDFSSIDDLFLTPTRETYANHTESNWYQNIRQQNNVRSDIKLITNEPTYNDRTKHSHLLDYQQNDGGDERSKYEEVEMDTEKTKFKKEDHGSNSGKIERISNIGSVKRVNLANTPVKSPAVKLDKVSGNPTRRNDIRPADSDSYSDEVDLEIDVFKNTRVESTETLNKVSSNTIMVGSANITIAHGNTHEKDKAIIETTESFLNNMNENTFTTKLETMTVTTEATENRHQNASSVGEANLKEINNQAGIKNRPSKVTETNPVEDKTERIQDKIEQIKPNNFTSNLNTRSVSVKYENSHDEKDSKASSENTENTSGEVKVNTVEKILKFIKVVAETITKNTKRGGDANGKTAYLNELKDSLLTNIKERLEVAWPEESPRRRSRAARGHVEFPSSESALMTISFLTFAVFLIKLVLQVIQTYKQKTMLMAPLMVATAGRTLRNKLRANT